MGIMSPSHMWERGLSFQLESVSAIAVLAHAGRARSRGGQVPPTIYVLAYRKGMWRETAEYSRC